MAKKDAEKQPIGPNLPSQLSLAQTSRFDDEECVELSLIQDCAMEEQTADNIVVSQVMFKNVVFTGVRWPNAKITDTVFEQSDLSNADFSRCFMERVQFRNCKMVGINMSEASLRNVVINNCNASYAVLRYFKCSKSAFHNTSFTEADIYSAALTDVGFSCCNLDRVQFTGTKLAGIDLSTCHFFQLALTLNELRGCIVAPAQVVTLATIFGVVIKAP